MMEASGSGIVLPASNSSGKTNSPTKGSKVSVSDFVSASFARFEAEYGPSAFAEVSTENETPNLSTTRQTENYTDKIDDNDEQDDEEEEEEEPFWSLLLTLYLPLLVFGLRRSTFGTFSFIRTFLLGHVLRLLISAVLFSIPTSFNDRFEKWWGSITKIYWVQHVLWALTGEEKFHPNNHPNHLGGGHYQCFNESAIGAVPVSGTRNKHPDQVWPPPALTLLTLVTVMAFIIHPDGLTWIIIGKSFDGLLYLVQLATVALIMLRDEPIHTIAAATSLAGIILLGAVIHKTLSPKKNHSVSEGESSGSSRKPKKGKKGRSGRHSNHNARGRGKTRGGHFRSQKDLYESPTRQSSRSRSPSLVRSEDLQKNEHDDAKSGTVSGVNGDSHSQKVLTDKSRNRIESADSAAVHLQSHNSLSKLRPYSVDSSLPQLSDDVSSCSSITGSLIDVPGSKPLKSDLEDVDKKSKSRKSKNQKRGKNTTAAGTQSNVSQTSASRAPPGFIANDPAMTPSRVSPLTLSNPSSSPYKGSDNVLISPVRKAISRPPPHSKANHNSNRALASTSDGIVKQPFSAQMPINHPSNVESIGKFPSQSLNQPPGIVRYGLPDYSAYAQSDSRYDPKKIELAAFLARVGLVGSACADLLRDLLDVDALAALTPQQLYFYNVGDEKQMEIAALLKARELRLLQQQMQRMPQPSVHTTSPVIRPPPGLGFGCPSPNLEPTNAAATLQTKPVQPIMRPLTQTRSFTPDSTSDFILSSPVSCTSANNVSRNNFTLQSLRASYDNAMANGNVVDPLIQASFHHNQPSRPLPIGSRLFSSVTRVERVQTEDEKIDADLQQLGDQMAGSILDF